MTALRQLSAVYVATAGAYAIALAMAAHPVWTKKAETGAAFVRSQGTAVAEAFDQAVIRPSWVWAGKQGAALREKVAEAYAPPQIVQPAKREFAPKSDRLAARVLEPVTPPPPRFPKTVQSVASIPGPHESMPAPLRGSQSDAPEAVARAEPLQLAPQAAAPAPSAAPDMTASLPPNASSSPADIIRVEQRLKDSLTSEMVENFELFLYVSKADSGPWAQHMYVFQKQASGDLVLLYNWPVSTGREKLEFNPAGHRLTTYTPAGYYELDPNRSYAHYRSMEWGKSMPYAMFFNWVKDGNQTGLAIHAATGDDVPLLGKRASAGCIHLSEDNARALFTMIRSQYRGLAPRFAIDRRTGTMSNDGILLHDASGNLQMADGYKVLVFIENYGGENVVAALY